ncbi:hypothetical protein J437_LFUL007439, partial [Ladona fulva]
LFLCIVYRPPKTNRIDELEQVLSRFIPTYRHITCCTAETSRISYIVTIFTLCPKVPPIMLATQIHS